MKINNILNDNIGFIDLVDHLGSDLTVINSARVSFGKRKDVLDDSDTKLINYLAKHKHYSPFRHVYFQFHDKAPEVVARQWWKHIVGSDYTFKDTAWNEISGRYVEYPEEFYIPQTLRKQSTDNKQASISESVDDNDTLVQSLTENAQSQYSFYRSLIRQGVCKEQARLVLPFSLYTEWYWSASLQAVINFISLRDTPHAQWEIARYGSSMHSLIEPIVPLSTQALLK